MKNRFLLRLLAMMLVCMTLLTVFAACSNVDDPVDDVDEGKDSATADTTTEPIPETTVDPNEFIYPDNVKFGGKEFNILNCTRDQWNMIAYITADSMTGEEVNDATFLRQSKIEDAFDCNIVETNVSIYDLKKELDKTILSGEYAYDAAYQRADETIAGILDNSFIPLDSVENIHLERTYWAQDLLDVSSLDNTHYFAASDLQLMSFDGVWCIYFNAEILKDRGIEAPYQLVKDGKWTLDQLRTIAAQACTLGPDESWDYNDAGQCVYGYATFKDGIPKLLFGIEALFGGKDASDLPYLACSEVGFTDRTLKLAEFCGEAGTYFYADPSTGTGKAYDQMFMDARSVFCGAEIQLAQKLRGVGMNYGMLPYPKFSETQESYHTTMINYLPVFTIPTTNSSPEDIGLIMDALSYEAHLTMADVYYGSRVSLKGTGDDTANDIAMLEIMRETRSLDTFVILGLGSTLVDQITWCVGGGRTNIESTVAKFSGSAITTITELRSKLTE